MSKIDLKKITKKTKRIGRGPGSGVGKTSGRGMNGQKSRTGSATKFFGGGQTSIIMRLPKRKGLKKRNKNILVLTNETAKRFSHNDSFDINMATSSLSKNKRKKIKKIKIIKRRDSGKDLRYDSAIMLSKSLRKSESTNVQSN